MLRLIGRGYPYKAIAKDVSSARTVETDVSSVLHRLRLSNRCHLTRWATDGCLI